jgi:hypothetical protein
MSGARAAGVSWNSRSKGWIAQIKADRGAGKSKQRHLGNFLNEVEAALAYDQAAREHHGDKAKLNFPEGPPLLAEGVSSEPSQAEAGQEGEAG